ncbi:MAG: hypothetical protein NVSMB6_19660 [Burkholderiaceae bacterium]
MVNYIREYQIGHGVPKAQAYDVTMYILAGMLVLGLICNLLVRPLHEKYFMSDEELAKEKLLAHERTAATVSVGSGAGGTTSPALVGLAWAAVGIPLIIGVFITLQKAAILFK